MNNPRNVKELRDGLCQLFADLRNGKAKGIDAKESNNAAGKIIGTVKLELEAAALSKTEPNIGFLNYDE